MTATNRFSIWNIPFKFFCVFESKRVNEEAFFYVFESIIQAFTASLTKNEHRNMKETKYAYAIGGDPQSWPSLPVAGSHSPCKQANIILFQASPVAHLSSGIEKSHYFTLKFWEFFELAKNMSFLMDFTLEWFIRVFHTEREASNRQGMFGNCYDDWFPCPDRTL